MYHKLALFNGVLLAIMIFLNGMLSKQTGPYVSTLIYHLIGLVMIVLVSIWKKNKLPEFRKLSVIYFLPGVLGVVTILLNNISIPRIGVTLVAGVGLFGQLVTSALIEHFGLFGKPMRKLRKEKMLGFTMILTGIIVMIIL